jgi:hypothetical protein
MKIHSLKIITLSAIFLGALSSAQAASVGFIKNSALYVITDIETGNTQDRRLDYAVGAFSMDRDSVVYMKGTSLWMIRDIRAATPRQERIESAVSQAKLDGDMIAYLKGSTLYVRPLDRQSFGGYRIDSGVIDFDVKDGVVVYRKNQVALYRVTDIERGLSERVNYPVGDFELAR